MRILVTGDAGFIGGHIVAELADAGHEAIGFDLIDGFDVRNVDQVVAALPGVDAVCHQAGRVGLGVDVQDFPGYASHNDVGTAAMLAAMATAGVRRLVMASSMVVYGEGTYRCAEHGLVAPGPRRPDDLAAGRFEPPCPICDRSLDPGLVVESAPPDPRNAYAASKVAKEHYARAWARAVGGSVIALRYHNVYGPGLPQDTPYAGVAALFRSALRRGEAPRVFEDGGQRRDFVHVRDVARANLRALEAVAGPGETALPDGFSVYNVGSGVPHTIGDLARQMAHAVGGPEPRVTGEYRLGDVRHITASSERIAAELGWKAEVAFAAGVADLADEDATDGADT